MSGTKILLVDDHKIVRKALKLFLANANKNFTVLEAGSGKEALDILQKQSFDLVVTDVNMPLMDGIELANLIRRSTPQSKVLALSMMNDEVNIKNMLKAGAKGYLLKDCDEAEFLLAVNTILSGGTYYSTQVKQAVMDSLAVNQISEKSCILSKREKEILNLIFQEYTNGEIAERLFISQRTVETHKRNIMEKTGAKNLAGLVKFALKNNLFTELFSKG